ncbi:MAG: hypothetical protein PQJ60_03280, partial [Spirochaetales bacterium]|nr:hypothetical protein [Spirochaetales bacterium]
MGRFLFIEEGIKAILSGRRMSPPDRFTPGRIEVYLKKVTKIGPILVGDRLLNRLGTVIGFSLGVVAAIQASVQFFIAGRAESCSVNGTSNGGTAVCTKGHGNILIGNKILGKPNLLEVG